MQTNKNISKMWYMSKRKIVVRSLPQAHWSLTSAQADGAEKRRCPMVERKS